MIVHLIGGEVNDTLGVRSASGGQKSLSTWLRLLTLATDGAVMCPDAQSKSNRAPYSNIFKMSWQACNQALLESIKYLVATNTHKWLDHHLIEDV
ncbi:hypothetical protein PILCRDRAFT_814957 [Piloderma croceum F 1598]|uniref:Uncharacterized protein n=1 Tax=Piloderma croceum (strain F 1598) TaxID=765440 RepID=A0A0C3G9Y7_PILCF|nr:hypothetical protein PILCRDRAFT_814957 [Piloderma croceum F 1598]